MTRAGLLDCGNIGPNTREALIRGEPGEAEIARGSCTSRSLRCRSWERSLRELELAPTKRGIG